MGVELKPYNSYKLSRNPYVTSIPATWMEYRFHNLVEAKCIQENQDEELLSVFLKKGVIRYSDTSKRQVHKPSEDISKYQLVEYGDLVMNNQQAWRGSVGVSKYRGIVSPAYFVFKLSDKIEPLYANYLFRDNSMVSQYLIASKGVGSIQRMLSYPTLKNAIVCLPPKNEQKQIVCYLHSTIIKINKFIKAKKKQISLFKEQKQALINNAVRQGVNPETPMKPSGIAWLGDIPSHWEVIQSNRLFSQRTEKARSDDIQLTASQKYGIISQEEFMRLENRRVTVVFTGNDILKHVEPNDFVISMRSFQGGLEYSTISGCISSAYVMLIPEERVEPSYFKWLFKSASYIHALQSTSNLIRDGQAMRFANFAQIPLVIFNKEEQLHIANYINEHTQFLEKAISKVEKEIDLISEYRTRLISDVVTGKVDVRGIVIDKYLNDILNEVEFNDDEISDEEPSTEEESEG